MTFFIDKTMQCLKRFADKLPRDLIRRGSALGLVLVFMTFMLILGTGLLAVGQYMAAQSRSVGNADSYYYAAESAAQLAAQLLLREVSATSVASGATSGALMEASDTVALLASPGTPLDVSDIAGSAEIQAMLDSIVATLTSIYQDQVKDIVEAYPPGSDPDSRGFNGHPVELVGLWMTSADGAYEYEVTGDPLELGDYQDFLEHGVAVVSGLDDPENYYAASSGDYCYVALAAYLANPNFRIESRSGGRTVEVNTNVDLEFSVGIEVATYPSVTESSEPGRAANVASVEIDGYIGDVLIPKEIRITVSEDELLKDEDELERLLNEYLADPNHGIVQGIPNNVRVDLDADWLDANTLTFIVSATNELDYPKQGPLRIILPGEILLSGEPLSVTRNPDAFWDIRDYGDGGGSEDDLLPGIVGTGQKPYMNDSELLGDMYEIIDNKLTAAKAEWRDRDYFINVPAAAADHTQGGFVPANANIRYVRSDNNPILGKPNEITVYPELEYIEANQLFVEGTVICPKLKGIYVTDNILIGREQWQGAPRSARLNPLLRDSNGELIDYGIRTKVSCNLLKIFCYPEEEPTQVNWCEFYTMQFYLEYNNHGGFISNSAYYLGLNTADNTNTISFSGTPNAEHGGVLPQFYFNTNCDYNTNSNGMIGCFFVSSEWIGRLFENNAASNMSEGMHGVFVGNFNKNNDDNFGFESNVFDSSSVDEWVDSIWNDDEMEDLLSGYEGRKTEEPPPIAYIEGETIIEGTAGESIERSDWREFRVIIENDMIVGGEPNDPKRFIWNLPKGMEAACFIEDGSSSLRFELWGVPETPLTDVPIDVIIPGFIGGERFMERGLDIDVEIEENEYNDARDVWAIAGVAGSYEEIRVATSSVTGGLTGKGADLRDITGREES
jgi:hypothetical protein